MFSAFQFGFDHGYQVVYPKIPAYNGRRVTSSGRHDPYAQAYEIKLEQARRSKLAEDKRVADYKLKAKEEELARIEAKRLSNLADLELQLDVMRLLKEIQALELEQQRLQQLILAFMRDDEDILLILCSMPFV